MHGEAHNSPQKSGKTSEFKKVLCRFCRSNNTIKRAKRKTQNRGLIQRYYCKDCKKRFTVDDGFFRMRNNPDKITFSLDAYFRGFSLRKLQKNLSVFQPHNCHHSTILRWIQKYCVVIGSYTDRIDISASQEIQLDEMEFKTKGRKSWFIDVIDAETPYMVSSGYFIKRSKPNVTKILRNAKNKTGEQIKFVLTDGNQMYSRILNKTFGLHKYPNKSKITHYSKIASEDGFNHKIERLHNSIRERTKIMREFKALHSAKAIMKGYEIFYNFCRKHQVINCFPYELLFRN